MKATRGRPNRGDRRCGIDDDPTHQHQAGFFESLSSSLSQRNTPPLGCECREGIHSCQPQEGKYNHHPEDAVSKFG